MVQVFLGPKRTTKCLLDYSFYCSMDIILALLACSTQDFLSDFWKELFKFILAYFCGFCSDCHFYYFMELIPLKESCDLQPYTCHEVQ